MRIRSGHPSDAFNPQQPELDLKKLMERMKSVELGKPTPETAASLKLKTETEQEKDGLTKEDEKDILKKTLELVDLIAPRPHLEYKIVEDAYMVQVHVVNTDDGIIVRKIPSDEIVKLVKQAHAMLAERFEVEA